MRYLKKYEGFSNESFSDIVDQVFVDLIDKNAKVNRQSDFRLINIFENLSTDTIKKKDTLDIALKVINNKKVCDGAIIQILNLNISEDVVLVIETANDYLKTKGYEFIAMEAGNKFYKNVLASDKNEILLYYKVNGEN